MKDGVILRVSKPARMGIDDAPLDHLRSPIQHKLLPGEHNFLLCPALVIDAQLSVFCRVLATGRHMAPRMEAHETAPLFKADNATFSFYATKDGRITVTYQGWDQSKVVLDG
jgi:hypothetical protein